MWGGSTMGYKLAGFDVIGCNEIDPRMMDIYKKNHNPKYSFLESIETFKLKTDLPYDLYNLDILDGSPPCSTFSMAGNREKDWGRKKKFREGQTEQVLDTLFFDFIELAEILQPKVVVAENVKGILLGSAIDYVLKIYEKLDKAGYYVQHFVLNAATMGVPQRRERVFFIALRKDLSEPFMRQVDMFTELPFIDMNFTDSEIPVKHFIKGIKKRDTQNYSETRFGDIMVNIESTINTITTDINRYWLNEETLIDDESLRLCGSFPLDYDFLNQNSQYVIGMSVPPVMMARIASEISNQWLQNIESE